MAIKTISKWFFGSEDKEEVKKYSREISVLFKLNGYNPKFVKFFDFFQIEDFEFIPCIKEGLFQTSNEDFEDFENKAVNALKSAYDSSVEVTLDDLVTYAELKNKSIDDLLKDLIDGMKTKFFVDFIDSCGVEIQSKFVDWIFNKSKK